MKIGTTKPRFLESGLFLFGLLVLVWSCFYFLKSWFSLVGSYKSDVELVEPDQLPFSDQWRLGHVFSHSGKSGLHGFRCSI